jgi:hypothetical protein
MTDIREPTIERPGAVQRQCVAASELFYPVAESLDRKYDFEPVIGHKFSV